MDGVEERYRELRRRPKLRTALWADREAAVVSTAHATGRELWVPVVPLRPRFNEPPPRLVDEPGWRDAQAGLDASGRAVVVRDREGRRVLTWDGPRLEIVAFDTHDDVTEVTWVDHDEAGRPARFATAEYGYNKPRIAFEVATCEWEGDRCVRVRRQVNDFGDGWREEVDEAEYDERGLVSVRAASPGGASTTASRTIRCRPTRRWPSGARRSPPRPAVSSSAPAWRTPP